MEIKIFDYGMNGEGVAKNDGKILLVEHTLIDEVVDVEIVKDFDNYAIAIPKQIKIKSSKRTEPVCPYFYECGGCNLQHMNYSEQLKFKTKLIKKTIKKITGYKVTKYYDTNQPIYTKERIKTGSYTEKQCTGYKTVTTAGTTSTSTHYEVLDASVHVGTNYQRVDAYYDDCDKQCTSHLVIKYLVTTTHTTAGTTSKVCAGYKDVTIPVYADIEVVSGYKLVTKTEPIYSYVKEDVKVKLYSSRTCTPKSGTNSLKWSTSNNDASLLNDGYKLTGNKRVK